MSRRKKNVHMINDGNGWRPIKDPWISSEITDLRGRGTNYYFTSPAYSIGYTWNNPVPNYHHEILHKREQHQRSNRNSMANLMPWLLSMSLLNVGKFAAHPGSDSLSRELQPPILSEGTFERSISQHDAFREHTTCETPTFEKTVEKRLQEPLQLGNNLYGSTPRLNDRTRPFSIPVGSRNLNAFKTNPHLINQLEFRNLNYGFINGRNEEEYIGPAMELVYAWPTIDFEFDTIEARDMAIYEGEYIAENNLPLGLEIWRDKVFLTLPKWKDGIPVTLATVPRFSKTRSPKLRPYPNWNWNRAGHCKGLTSVFRIQVDECNRLWVLDSGRDEVAKKPKNTCPPALFIFDLMSDTLIRKYILPEDQAKPDSLFTNIVVDIRNNDCGGATAYLSDVFRFGLIVYDFYKDSSFRVDHHFFYPDPLASRYDLHGLKFQWTDGIFGLALSPIDVNNDRTLFFHPMSSFREFAVTTSIFKDQKTADKNTEKFTPIGRPRAKDYGHSSGSVIDKRGVMFFNMVTRDSVWCWDTRKEYIPQNLGVVGTSNVSLVFPNDVRVDHEPDQSVWVLSNRLPMYLYGRFDSSSVNFRVYRANIKDAVKDTVCDPNYVVPDSEPGFDETC